MRENIKTKKQERERYEPPKAKSKKYKIFSRIPYFDENILIPIVLAGDDM